MAAIHVRVVLFGLGVLSLAPAVTAQIKADPNAPLIVDARGQGALPSGVPRLEAVETSPGKEAWLRGMDAVVAGDWQLARAWFQTAQRKDPTNAALARATDLANWTLARNKALPLQPQPLKSAHPTPAEAATVTEMARLEAALDKAFESVNPSAASPSGDSAALDVVRAAEQKRVERANLAFADRFAREAINKVRANDFVSAIELLRLADLMAPQVTNFRATREWLEIQVRQSAGVAPSAQEAERQLRAREDELRRAEGAAEQAQHALALAREYHDAEAEQIAQGALQKAAAAVAAAKAQVAAAHLTADRLKASAQKDSTVTTRPK